ncbi:hypothetical protein [Nitrospina watsonii]|uniref:Uncharacterized protein n=1 Tax=Nitrospina watsonii TaxID=1323948 RepID=A0ABM9HFW3_9BACT|nr:hypothetical protein [Nitrospina watsonii]CAI2719099.1 conserved protein of unknown function [Nitrospina watsonii]
MSEQDTQTNPEDTQAPEDGQEENQRTDDPMSDLSELEKIKKELEAEKAKAAQELEEGDEEDEDLREVDYLQKVIDLCVKFDHHVGVFLMAGYIDCGLKYNHQLADSYMKHLATIQGFLRLLEKVDGVTRETVTKDCIVRMRNVIQEIHKHLVKPVFKEVGLMKKKPNMENLEKFQSEWNERLNELQNACDFEYQILDVKKFMVS